MIGYRSPGSRWRAFLHLHCSRSTNEASVGARARDDGSHFEAAIGANMGLDIHKGTIVFDPFESVSRVCMHLVVTVRGAAI